MKISPRTLLIIDRWFLLPRKVVTSLFNVRKPRAETQGRSMVIKLMGLGSIIRFASLCDETGADKKDITLVTFDQHREVGALFGFEGMVFIRTNSLIYFILDCWSIFLRAGSRNISRIIDFERCSNAVGLFSSLLAGRNRCKRVSFEKRADNLYSAGEDIYSIDLHSHEGMLRKGIEYLSKTERESGEVLVDVNPKKVLVNVNASEYLLARRYPKDAFMEMIAQLHVLDRGLRFYFTGSRNENGYVESVVRELSALNIPALNVSGKWSLTQLAKELADSAIFITGDSGPLHLAAYLKVPMLAIWGPTQAAHFGYQRYESIHDASLNLACSPCFKDPTSQPAKVCQGRIDCMKMHPASLAEQAHAIVLQSGTSRKVFLPAGLLKDSTHAAIST